MKDTTKEKIVKWGLIGIGSIVSAIGAMVKLKPEEEPIDEAPKEIEVEFEVKDEEEKEVSEEG